LQILTANFLILKRIQRDIDINLQMYSCKVPAILDRFQLCLNFLD